MMTEEQRRIILHYAREYQVDEVILFGSVPIYARAF